MPRGYGEHDEQSSLASRRANCRQDAAHALGARYRGVRVGVHSDFVCFSFQAIKHITTGDGGALTCRRQEDVHSARRNRGKSPAYEAATGNQWEADITHDGYKGNLNEIAGALGVAQMECADAIFEAFHQNGLLYQKLLLGIPGLRAIRRDSSDASAYWGFCLLAENRAGLMRKLREHGVESRQIHARNDLYSVFQPYRRDLPGVDAFDPLELSLPCGWWVRTEDVARIADILRSGW